METVQTLLSYNNDLKLKEAFLAELAEHRRLDSIVKGTYGEIDGTKWRGCAVGCSVKSLNKILGTSENTGSHEAYELLGLPAWLAHVEDGIFESLPIELAVAWPQRLAEAIPVGVSLDGVKDEFMHWILVDEKFGVVNTTEDDEIKGIVRAVADCYARRLDGREPTEEEWQKVGELAWAAWAARDARAAWAAWAAWAARDARAAWAAA